MAAAHNGQRSFFRPKLAREPERASEGSEAITERDSPSCGAGHVERPDELVKIGAAWWKQSPRLLATFSGSYK